MSDHEDQAEQAAAKAPPRPPVYLGDGVYLSDDGYQLWLAVGAHTNPVIALDYTVFQLLIAGGTARFEAMGTDI